jgi:hypothetical protein
MARKPTDTIKLQLRLPEYLRRQLERAADVHGESMNTEIVDRLKESFERDDANKVLREAFRNVQQVFEDRTQVLFNALSELTAELRKNRPEPPTALGSRSGAVPKKDDSR